ncbi:MAG: endonuclease/exonuclease/phosphatase family protein [Bacteroidia bacterium]|nr:endonuclease/exonuclease/phosphatase family protein [Bacteroidia bacterium]
MQCACDPFDTQFDEDEVNVSYYEASSMQKHSQSDTLLVMTWNIKFGGARIEFFFDCFGDRSLVTEEEIIENLQNIADQIEKVKPDILLIQEIDMLSKRTAYIDQIQWVLDNTDFNYGVYASGWKADYVASDGIGRINSGNAIFSKWELKNAERVALPLRTDQAGYVKYFYLKRCIIKATCNINSKEIHFLNIHASAWDTDSTRKKQINIFKDELDLVNSDNKTFIAGGDLNTAPPGSVQLTGFDDQQNCDDEDYLQDDYTHQTHWVQGLFDDYKPAIPLSMFQSNNDPYFTFTSDKDGFWNRKIDYLFTNGSLVDSSGTTYQDTNNGGIETMPLSDHAPVSFKVVIRN